MRHLFRMDDMDFFEMVNHFLNREREVIQNPLAPERGASTDGSSPPRYRSKRACGTSKGHSNFDS